MSRGHAFIRPTYVEVDLAALRGNAARLSAIARVPLYAVLKADAYGHGAIAVATDLARGGAVAGVAVSLVEEGVELREAGITLPVLVLGPALAGGYDDLVAHRLIPVVSCSRDLEAIDRAGARRGIKVAVHLKVDTGMGRLGLGAEPDALAGQLTAAAALPHIDVHGVATHLACADLDNPDDPDCMTHAQLARFDAALATARAAGIEPRAVHAANSAATLWFPASRKGLVRCGLALYGNGLAPPDAAARGGLRQVMRLVSHIAQIRPIPAGGTVSYGALWRARNPATVAVLPVGYADGVPRSVTGKAEVLVHGRRCPVVGAVSMDMALVDVTHLGPGGARVGDEVVLLGAQGQDAITTAEFAGWAGCIEYEVTCGMSRRVPRVLRGALPAPGREDGGEHGGGQNGGQNHATGPAR